MSEKTSFVELPVSIDVDALRADYARLSDDTFERSYWPGAHGFVDFVLLRGGARGDETDFYTQEPVDRPILAEIPYIADLIGPDGPFGGVFYAYIFRMKPNGVARLHRDAIPIWHSLWRVHVPIEAPPDARLVVADRRGLHFEVGGAWSFDNQDLHGFINGDRLRAHLIIDVPPFLPAMVDLVERARHVPGEPVSDEDWQRLQWPDTAS